MRRARLHTLALVAVTLPLLGAVPLLAQIHKVQKSEPVTRAVAVYEYAGDLKKPTAARLIPVSLFIGGHFENAGTYLARPIPFALDTGNVYELQHAGEPLGTLDLAYAKNLRGSSAEVTVPFDTAWFGYGRFSPERTPNFATIKTPARHTQHAYAVQDDGKPHFGSKPADTPRTQASSRDPRDTTDVDPDADRTQRVSLPDDDNRNLNAPNPDRPTLRRRPEDTTGGPKSKRPKETSSVTAAGAGPDKDPDRPVIKRKAAGASDDDDIPPDPSEVNSANSVHGSAGTVSAASTASANGVIADNGRPELRRNTNASASAPAVTQAASMPGLQAVAAPGLPPDLQMTVAVSDPKDRPVHDFSTAFASESERAAAMGELRMLALAVLHDPALATDAPAFALTGSQPAPSTVATSAATHTRTGGAAHRTASSRRATAKPTAPVATATETLQNEQIAAYTLNYNAPLTYVYTAQTAPSGAAPVRFVTVVAQRDLDGKLNIGLRSVTDAAHLDRTPRYRLVDAVDADASNRADLLFELRDRASRQFALYRFLGPKPDQVFVTDTTK